MDTEKYEQLASIQHDIWAHWMMYMFSKCEKIDGGLKIPQDLVDKWKLQADTMYSDLSEREKDSDREQVDKLIHLLSV